MRREHEHFCNRCYGVGNGRKGSIRGWWACPKHPCVKGMDWPCKYHRDLDAKRAAPTETEGA